MKPILKFLVLLCLSFTGQAQNTPADYVDPLMGSHDSRWIMFPGPTRPFGMVKISPDNQDLGWKAGYEYDIENIAGFSHLHSWTMAGLRTMPTNGPLKIKAGNELHPERGYRSKFSHENEEASTGFYSVNLDDYGIKAELTSTKRASFQRYTYPEGNDSRVLVDLLIPSEYGYEIFYTEIKKISDTEIEGVSYQQSQRKANYNEYELHFVMRFDKPFKSMNGWVKEELFENVDFVSSGFGHKDVGAYLSFDTEEGEQIQVQTGISLVSVDQARLNLETEMDSFNWDFEAVVADSKKEWNSLLSSIAVEDRDPELKKKFYTNLYRVYAGRTTWNDVNGAYKDMYEKVQYLPEGVESIYGSDGFWISIWNLNQVWSLATPDLANSWVKSMLEISDKGGWLPKGPTGIEYSAIMVASHQISLLANAYQKGIRDYDVDKMYQAVKKLQDQNGQPHEAGGYVGNRHLDLYKKFGYVPDEDGPVSNTLAYAYDDWTVGQLAKALGHEKDYKHYTGRSFNYENIFDPEVGFMRRKKQDGTWVENFNEYGDVTFLGSGFVEGNAWQYTFFVPHDVNGLIKLIGKDEFNNRLNDGFEKSAPHNFNSEHLGSNSLDGMGVLPINHGNQPNMQAAYLFNYSGKPWLTQKWSNAIMQNYYGTGPEDGWKGDEDQGQMGAWYVMSSMGLFQMDGGASERPIYEIGSPQFEKVTINLDPKYYKGGTFTIRTINNAKDHPYVQWAKLNGKKLEQPWFYHDQLTAGGELVLKMGPKPNKKWGSAENAAPPSLSTLITAEEKKELKAYDRDLEALEEWNKAMKAYYYHKKEHFETLPNTEGEIIFLGNSITDGAEWFEMFSNPNVKNRGIGGDDTDGVLDRLSEVTESMPEKVFLMIGTNDLAYGKDVDYIVANHRKIVAQIKKDSPNTTIYLESVLPVLEAIHYTRPTESIKQINEALKQLAASEDQVEFIELFDVFADENDQLNLEYSIDGLHLNGKGYEVWRKILLEYVN